MNPKIQSKSSPIVKGWVFLIVLFFTLTLTLTLVSISLNRTLFSEEFFKNVLAQQRVYDQVPAILAETTLPDTNAQSAPKKLFNVMSLQQVTDLYLVVLPQNYLQNQTEQILDSLFKFVNLKTYDLKIRIDLTPIKENLQGQAGTVVLNQVIAALPECNVEQIRLFSQWMLQQTTIDLSQAPICKPTEPYLSLVTPILNSYLQKYYQALPASITLIDAQTAENTEITNSQMYKTYFTIRKLLLNVPWAALFFAILLFLLNLRSLRSMFSSFGIPMFLAGGICVLVYLFAKGFGQSYLTSWAQNQPATALNSLVSIEGLVFLNQIVWVGCWIGGIVCAVGLLLQIVSVGLKK